MSFPHLTFFFADSSTGNESGIFYLLPFLWIFVFLRTYAGTRAISEDFSVCGNAKKFYLIRKFSSVPAIFLFFGNHGMPGKHGIVFVPDSG